MAERRISGKINGKIDGKINETLVIVLVGAAQFVNVLDFMMVMPLGPDFARALGIPMARLGLVAGAYAAAAAVTGLCGAFFLDRFDRRKALAVALAGLAIGTALGALAWDLPTLMAARVVAGAFGGPATSLAFSIVSDVVPEERRGRAMGAVMSAFAIASIAGVPAGLELARLGSWRLPFLAVGALGAIVTVVAAVGLPPLRLHLERRGAAAPAGFRELISNRLHWLSWTTTALVMGGGFVLIPNISAYLQQNLHYPRSRIGLLYLAGGAVSIGTVNLVGWLVDRFGSFRVGSFGCALVVTVVYAGFVDYDPRVPVIVIFVAFMVAMGFRNVAYNTLATKVPAPALRARFQSVQSSIQHTASALGPIASSMILSDRADGTLAGIPSTAYVMIALTLVLPVMFWMVETRVRLSKV